jgi:hypothetical protein
MNSEHQITQALLRAWPFPRGAGRILDRYFSKLSFGRTKAIVRTTDGFEITVAPNELIGRHIYLTGEFDRSVVEVLCNFSEPGDTLLDIGANIGYVSACFLNNVRNSDVLAVEPQPDVWKSSSKISIDSVAPKYTGLQLPRVTVRYGLKLIRRIRAPDASWRNAEFAPCV